MSTTTIDSTKGRLTISTVGIDSLEQPEDDPDVDGDNVEVLSEVAVDERAEDGASSKDENLSGVSVLSGQTEGRRVLVVDFVNVLVQDTSVQGLVGLKKEKVSSVPELFQYEEGRKLTDKVEEVFEAEEQEDLREHDCPMGERDVVCLHAKSLSSRVEKPDLSCRFSPSNKPRIEGKHTKGSSIVKCENRTCLVHAHCSSGVGTLFGCSFHRRK